MVFVEKCCCGCSLKKGALIICYYILSQEIITFLSLILIPDDPSTVAFYVRNGSGSDQYIHTWAVVFNIIIICTGLYGIYKQKAPFMIPFLAYRTVNLIFMIFTLANARAIANNLGENFSESGVEETKMIDFLPLVAVILIVAIVFDFYCLLIVFSYYKLLMQNTTVIAVAMPVVVYTQHPHPAQDVGYPQPATNPYIVDAKLAQHYNTISHPPPPNYAYSNSSYGPPPYRA